MQQSRLSKRICLFFVVPLGLLSGFGSKPTQADQPRIKYELADLEALQDAFVELADKIRPSVVAIRTYRVRDRSNSASRSTRRPHSQGSGFIIDADGYIATNRHVIEGSDIIDVVFSNGSKAEAVLVQSDRRIDLAVLKVDAPGLPAVSFNDTADFKVNQWVFAVGNPFGLANDDGRVSVTYGVISALGRRMTERLVGNSQVEYYGNMIETSAAINPGSSGGPLFNLQGEVIGIVTAIETSSGVSEGHGFALPFDHNTTRILKLLKNGKSVHYGFLGVKVQDVNPPVSRLVVDSRIYHGALLSEVNVRRGPADLAGLRSGDVVIEYDDHPVENSDHLVRLVGFTPVGTSVPLIYLRRGVRRETTVTVADRFEMMTALDE